MPANTNATNKGPSVSATLDTFLLVMDLVASDVLQLTLLMTTRRLHYLHGMLLYVIPALVWHMFVVEHL